MPVEASKVGSFGRIVTVTANGLVCACCVTLVGAISSSKRMDCRSSLERGFAGPPGEFVSNDKNGLKLTSEAVVAPNFAVFFAGVVNAGLSEVEDSSPDAVPVLEISNDALLPASRSDDV